MLLIISKDLPLIESNLVHDLVNMFTVDSYGVTSPLVFKHLLHLDSLLFGFRGLSVLDIFSPLNPLLHLQANLLILLIEFDIERINLEDFLPVMKCTVISNKVCSILVIVEEVLISLEYLHEILVCIILHLDLLLS